MIDHPRKANGSGATTVIGGRGIQSIEVSGRILSALTAFSQPVMLRDLAAAAKIGPAQAHAYLVSLRNCQLVDQDPASGRYLLGPFALRLGLARLIVSDPLRMASEGIAELSDRLNLMITVTVWGPQGPTVARLHDAATQLHANIRAGTLFSMTGTATGRVFAAFAPPDLTEPLIRAALASSTHYQPPAGVKSLTQFRRDVARVRNLGYATTDGRPIPGISAISVPVFGVNQELHLALTAIGPSSGVDTGPASSQTEILLAFARQLKSGLQKAETAGSGANPGQRAVGRARRSGPIPAA